MKELQRIHLQDYRPPDFGVEHVALEVSISDRTSVRARLDVRRIGASTAPLVLDGRGLELRSISLDGRPLLEPAYRCDAESLTIAQVPDQFSIETIAELDPESNTSLEGLYRSGPMLCTQCEARGFSRITYSLDRPDVLSSFRVRIEADAARFPVLLANGNRIEEGQLAEGRHYAIWDDPFPKPCYLFALVAGDLACVEDEYLTGSGRRVQIRFFVDRGNESRVAHGIASLKSAMRWDEEVFGLEYDLDTYMVVAAREFNMGAMENKGLNLFNARYVLASSETATDDDYEAVESVIAHEYFHNWTGNRVTCRDWFQLSLKEGLTVFRDQWFSEDQGSAAVTRIDQVRQLRAMQFPEDAGPMSHPVRPESYAEVNNLYTATVYEKGAEIVRMLRTRIGREAFITGLRRYLREHDGTAATIEDFIAALEAESGISLSGFRAWYGQSGTPQVEAWDEYDLATGDYRLHLTQFTPATSDQAHKQPLPIPIRFQLRDADGGLIDGAQQLPALARPDLILLEQAEAELVWKGLDTRPTPSFLLGYSAPVKLRFAYDVDRLAALLLQEDDGFVRWEAAQQLIAKALDERLAGAAGANTHALLNAFQKLAAQTIEDKALLAELLRLPAPSALVAQVPVLDGEALEDARQGLRRDIACALTGPLSVWVGWAPIEPGADCRARRSLANLALWYLAATASQRILDLAQARSHSPNMSLASGALAALKDFECPQRTAAMQAFRERFRGEALVLDKWFAFEAGSARAGGVERVQELLRHPDYSANPNRVRAVLVTFWRENLRAFHRADGAGYRLLAEQIASLDERNPQLAGRLVEGLLNWRQIVEPGARHVRDALQDLGSRTLSPDVREKVNKALP